MKLDSEEQRKELLTMLATVRVSTTLGQLGEQHLEYVRFVKPIIEAKIESPEKMVVPIEFLAPDTPNRVRKFEGMPEVNGGE